jgi:hypothetical protein
MVRAFTGSLVLLAMPGAVGGEAAGQPGRIRPYAGNPAYWQYKDRPLLLLGGSSNDNLFQTPDVVAELDRLRASGGNYVRNTMSSRDEGDVQAFHRDPDTGQYDLTRWNDAYWRRLDHFLRATHEREIIVQVEIWATYDFYSRESHFINGRSAWDRNPFNPANNINYNERETGLYATFRSTHGTLINPFFMTVLPLARPYDFTIAPALLGFQQRFVDKLLSVTLEYDHVLYVIDNETNTDPAWPAYWSQYIRRKAAGENLEIEVTEMWDTFDPTDGAVPEARVQSPDTHFFSRRATPTVTLKDPENFSFIEISNHNFQQGEAHFKTGHWMWSEVRKSGIIRPINNTKIYGSDAMEWTGSHRHGQERFWRNIFAGHASVRFHRPPGGIGHSDLAMSHIRSMRMFADRVNVMSLRPQTDLLGERDENEAYCLAGSGRPHAVVFMDGGEVLLDISALGTARLRLEWLDIAGSVWSSSEIILRNESQARLQAPGRGFWLGVVSGE